MRAALAVMRGIKLLNRLRGRKLGKHAEDARIDVWLLTLFPEKPIPLWPTSDIDDEVIELPNRTL